MFTSRGTPLLLAVLLTALLPAAPAQAGPDDARFRFETGGGVYIPFGENTRDAFGSGGDFHVGVSAKLGADGTWFVLGGGIIRSSGRDFPADGTFTAPESRYTAVPISFGVRHISSGSGNSPVRLTAGAGFLTVLSRYEPPFGDANSTATFGLQGDLGPEVSLSRSLSLFVREKLILVLDAAHDAAFRDLNHSGATLSAGFSWDLE